MANDYYIENWKNFLKCKECWEFKEICKDNRYSHNEWFLGVLWRCKECIKKWRRTEKERIMARKRDNDRYHNNLKRRSYIFETSTIRRKIKWYNSIHLKTERRIKELWIRPENCPICWKWGRIIAHHYDYTKPFNIVFCCDICHSKIHNNKIKDISNYIVIL